jgi:hypothetical protein
MARSAILNKGVTYLALSSSFTHLDLGSLPLGNGFLLALIGLHALVYAHNHLCN